MLIHLTNRPLWISPFQLHWHDYKLFVFLKLTVRFKDAGACLTIMHIRVYYKYCPQTIHNLAEYERTNAGASSSPAAAEGRCVANAIQVRIAEIYIDLI